MRNSDIVVENQKERQYQCLSKFHNHQGSIKHLTNMKHKFTKIWRWIKVSIVIIAFPCIMWWVMYQLEKKWERFKEWLSAIGRYKTMFWILKSILKVIRRIFF